MKKSPVTGVAGSVRILELTFGDLTAAEKHGKRLDTIGPIRAINEITPVTTTGLDLVRLYHEHVEGAFVPKASAKALQVLIQFPMDLVDGADADGMLYHARAFATKVFGDAAIFADRVDRDEKSKHVVDLFVAPKYEKTTKKTSKLAVATTRNLKELAKKYGRPAIPRGYGRALQDALHEYLRDEMGLERVKRGSPKISAGSDHKQAEELRMEELDSLIEGARNQQQENDRLRIELQGALAIAEAEAARSRKQQEAIEAAAAEAERRQAAMQQAYAEEAQAALTTMQAETVRLSAELSEKMATAEAERKAVEAERLQVERQRTLHANQIALLEKATDDRSALRIRLARHPTGDAGFAMDEREMSAGEWATYMAPWHPGIAAVARWVVKMVEAARDFAAKLLDREAEMERRETALAEREAAAKQELEERRNSQQREHAVKFNALAERNAELVKLEVEAARTLENAVAREAAAKARESAAEQAVQTGERWIRALALIDANPDVIVIDGQRTASFDPRIAKTFGAEFAETMRATMPEWVDAAITSKLELAERFHALAQREHRATATVRELETLIERAGPILSPVQQGVANDANQTIRNASGLTAQFNQGI